MGSSSSSTFGSPISRRMSCSRRRSPPLTGPCTSVRPLLAAEAEALDQSMPGGQLAAVAEARAAADLLDRLQHAQVRRGSRPCPGRGSASRTVAPRVDLARVRLQLAREQLHQRRLARAVDADQREPVARAEAPGGVAQQHRRRRRPATTSSASITLLPSRERGEAQQLGAVARLGLVGDQRVGGLDPELRLGRARRRPAPQPRELLADQLLAALLARRGLALALGAREHVRRVAALVLVHVAVGDLPRVRAHGVQEPAIVGDDEHRAAARGEVAREPVHALDVEVVRGLVEQQQLGVAEQRLGQRDPAPLAAATAARSACPARAGSAPSPRRRAARRARCGSARRPPTRGPRARRPAPRGWSARESRSSPWPSIASDRPPTRVTAPASGSSMPAISRSSVDLPSPLRPTMPIRSPAETPSVTSLSTVRAA